MKPIKIMIKAKPPKSSVDGYIHPDLKYLENKSNGTKIPYVEAAALFLGFTVEGLGRTKAITQFSGVVKVVELDEIRFLDEE